MKLSKPAIVTGVILLVVVFIGAWFAGNYNSLVSAREDVENSWAKVETQYQGRLDKIDQLVGAVKGSLTQEQKVFGQIADARKMYDSAQTTDEKAAAASQIETNVVSLVPRLQEAYPELKSNERVAQLMNEITAGEGNIAKARDFYNDTVTNYNKNVQRFPKSVFAGMFGFDERKQFKAESGAEKAPEVNL